MGIRERLGNKSSVTTAETRSATTGADVLPNAEGTEQELRRFRRQHQWDPFLDIDKLDNIDDALASGNAEKEAAIDESLIQEDSPYPEVRNSVCIQTDTPWRRILHGKHGIYEPSG
jgi:hypothetical protein